MKIKLMFKPETSYPRWKFSPGTIIGYRCTGNDDKWHTWVDVDAGNKWFWTALRQCMRENGV